MVSRSILLKNQRFIGAALKLIGDKFVIVVVSDYILPSRLKIIFMINRWVNNTSKQTNKLLALAPGLSHE